MMMSRRESVRLMQAAASARPLAIVASASLVICKPRKEEYQNGGKDGL